MNIKSLFVFAIAVALCSCQSSNKASSQNQSFIETEIEERVEDESETEDDEVTIVSSPDGLVCFYSRNNQAGDAVYGWSLIYEVKGGNKVYTYEGLPDWEGEGASINRIYHLPHPKRHLYLLDAFTRISGAYGYQSFITYELKAHELRRVPIIVNELGEIVKEIGYEYNFGNYYFRFARALTYDYQYMWNEDKGVFYYPLLQYDSYFLNDRFVVYHWDGSYLKSTTDTVCNPRLYEPLQNYAACLQHTKAGDVQVRVDSLPDGRLRYVAWTSEKDINTQPDIVLYGERKGNEFHFYNPPSYTYVVTMEDVPEIRVYYGDTIGHLDKLTNYYKED